MRHHPWLWLACLFWLTLLAAAQAQQGGPWIQGATPHSQFESDSNGDYFVTGGGVASNATATITFDRAWDNELTGEVLAEGDVTILDKGHIWRGTNFIYNFKTGDVRAAHFKTTQGGFSVAGSEMQGLSNKVYAAGNAFISTDDYQKPAYTIRARTIVITPGVSFEAYHATLYVGKVPVFYWPYYKRSLGQHRMNFEFLPGYRSIFGPYLLSAFNWYGYSNVDGTIHFDERERRGIAAGPDLSFHLGNWGNAAFRYYYADDHDPGADGIVVQHLNGSRQIGAFSYEVMPTTNSMIKALANYQSDPLVVRDFYESRYNGDVEPASVAEGNYLWPNWVADTTVQPQLVNFFATVERLPDVKLTGLRQELGNTPLYYESENSVGYFKRVFSDTNTLPLYTNDGLGFMPIPGSGMKAANYAATRADTFQQLRLPETFFGWLNVTPRVGGRLTYYSDVTGTTAHTNAQVRGVFNTGIDFNWKASRVYDDAESDLLDVHSMRHIIEPDIDYAYVPAPTRGPQHLPQFDYQIPTLRLLPIEFPDYNDIDSIGQMNVVRLTLRNIFQTKREGQIQDLINWAVYGDLNLDPHTNRFTDIYSDFEFRPRSWLSFTSSTRYDVPDDRWREAIERMVIQPNTKMSLALSYYYLMNNDPEFQTYPGEDVPGHNLTDLTMYYKMNENWGARITERYEAQDGYMQEQLYSVYRDLRSWTAALSFRIYEGPAQPTDFTVAVTFSLKAFPRYGLGSDSNHPGALFESASTPDILDQY